MAEKLPNIKPGEVVPGGFTHPNNAKASGDFFYIRDINGNKIGDRRVDDGDSMTVLDVSYSRQLALVQYPAGSVVRQGYIKVTKNIVYFKQGQWHNGSTAETVYDADDKVLGSLDPYESATPLYSAGGKINVVYNTDKGPNTKSGYVVYAGTGSSSGSGLDGGIAPGEVVPGGFTYANNAQVVGDELYLRDVNGNRISGRSVSNGDKITVLDVGYTKQLALVQYPAGSVVRQGYVTNATNLIRYFNQSEWHNGSTSETVYDEKNSSIGLINPYESATPIYKRNGMIHVVYNTGKGANTKSGFVHYEGTKPTIVTIPQPSVTNAQRIVYGKSGKGRDLAAYKIGSGSNSLILNCAIHGWEDHWPADGIELTRIGNAVIEHFQKNSTKNWTIYVIPAANPDGLAQGSTNNGAGRCTVVGGVDCNRDFPIGFTPYGISRYWTGAKPLSVPESKDLHDFIAGIKSKTSGQTDVIDLHGWEDKTIGDSNISQCFQNQFHFAYRYNGVYQNGFLITWANSIGCNAALIELPASCYSHATAVNGNYAGKVINAISAIIGTSGGSSSGGSTSGGSSSSDVGYTATGTVINVQSNLNVRKGPGTNYDSIGKLYEGNTVSIVAKNGEWYKIKFGSGSGYVSNKYIKVSVGNHGKSLAEALRIFNSFLKEYGFTATFKDDDARQGIDTGAYIIEACIGHATKLNGDSRQPFYAEIKDKKVDILTKVPLGKYADIQGKLNDLAISLEYGNISMSINANSISIEVSTELDACYVAPQLYCNITITFRKGQLDAQLVAEYDYMFTRARAFEKAHPTETLPPFGESEFKDSKVLTYIGCGLVLAGTGLLAVPVIAGAVPKVLSALKDFWNYICDELKKYPDIVS